MNALQQDYLNKANMNMPNIRRKTIKLSDSFVLQQSGDKAIIDLGNYYVGYFAFTMDYVKGYGAPVRFKVKFCETKEELEMDFSTYKGTLSASWLQEEIVTIDNIGKYKMPRRYAARYIEITILSASDSARFSKFEFVAVSSANDKMLQNVDIKDKELAVIDNVAINTLKNCMHRVFEDGPKRDRRLWIGDLYLESLANYYTFNQLDIVCRCLYLFSAADTNEVGVLPSHVYENPRFVSGDWFLQDYALLFVVALCEYYLHTSDEETFLDIYPMAKSQIDAIGVLRDDNGAIVVGKGCDVFIDWTYTLRKTTSLNGVYLYTLNILCDTLKKLNHCDFNYYNTCYKNSLNIAKRIFIDGKTGLIKNKYDEEQKSVHSAVWLILGDVINGDAAWEILRDTLYDETSEKPITPYMNHYLVEAMIKLGKKEQAEKHVKAYWGAMVEKGADSFYEVFVPGNPELSPYENKMMNSMCHAWSCTPTYFIRKILG